MSLKRQSRLELELEHTVNILRILTEEVIEKEHFPKTIERVQTTINNATKLLGEK
jgi:hypothetical protein